MVLLKQSLYLVGIFPSFWESHRVESLQAKFSNLFLYFWSIKKLAEAWWLSKKLVVLREDGTLFVASNSFRLCFSHTRYAPSILRSEQELQTIVEHEAGER